MTRSTKIGGWRQAGLCSLLCLCVHASAISQTRTPASPAPATPPNSAAAPAATAPHPSSGQTAAKHTPSSSHRSTHTSSHASAHTSGSKSKAARGQKVVKKRGQQAIDSARARQIQTALIREHYMQGEPSGSWDSATQAAMQRYQADQGWQSKTTPDARALIKLGLGPSPDHLLNPESAMTTSATPVARDSKAPKPAPTDSNLPQQ
jgi:hypothetical protein